MSSVVTIGVFDGVHLGHRAILSAAREAARRLGVEREGAREGGVIALTLDPHPALVLRPESQPPRISSCEAKLALLREAGADEAVVLQPTRELLSLEPRAFVEDLVRRWGAAAFVEGSDFRFGRGRRGDMTLLRELGREASLEVIECGPVEVELEPRFAVPVSSSLVRWLVGCGRVQEAARALGRPFELSATVVRGERRGRELGIPTANLDAAELADYIIPADGVYAGSASVEGEGERAAYRAAISVGVKPMFGGRELTVEAHLLDYTPDDADGLYGRRLTVHFERWLRDQWRYPGVASLRAQLTRDLERSRERVHSPATIDL